MTKEQEWGASVVFWVAVLMVLIGSGAAFGRVGFGVALLTIGIPLILVVVLAALKSEARGQE